MKLETLCYEEILGFEPSNVTTNISTLHIIIRILETSNENPEHTILKLKEPNLHHYLLDTIIFFIIIKIFHVKPLVMLSKLVVDVVLEVLTNACVTSNSWPTSHAYAQLAAPLPALNTQTRWGVCVWGVLREEIGKGGEYVTARREWTKLDEMYLISWAFAPKRKILIFLLNLLSYIINIAAKPNHARHVPLFWTHFEDQTEMAWGTQILLRLRHSYQRNLKFQSYSGRGIHSMNFNISETEISSSKRLCGARMKQLNKFQDRTGQNEGKPSFNFCFGVLVILQPV